MEQKIILKTSIKGCYTLSKEDCKRIGGHCWEIQNEILCSIPPQSVRICKHCGKREIGRPQDSIVWG